MGVLVNKTLDNGLKIVSSYVKVSSFSGTKEGVDFWINYYADYESRKNGKPYILQEMYSFVPNLGDGPNFIKQMYQYLKTLEQFKDAINIFEEGQQ